MTKEPRLTLKRVNAALAAAGAKEQVFRDKDYLYFSGGNASAWRDGAMVMVPTVGSLSVDEWVAEWRSRDSDFRRQL